MNDKAEVVVITCEKRNDLPKTPLWYYTREATQTAETVIAKFQARFHKMPKTVYLLNGEYYIPVDIVRN